MPGRCPQQLGSNAGTAAARGGGAGKGGRLNGILSLPLYTFLKGLPRRSQSAVLGGNSPAVALVPEKALTQLVPIATSASGGLFLLIS